MADLPRELWDCIAEEIEYADLLNLARVSWLHAWVCWRLLVRQIVLDHNSKKWHQTLSLIQRHDLSRHIRDLTILNFSRIRGSAWARDLFATLAPSGLRSLAVVNTSIYFANAPLSSKEPFVVKLIRISPFLESIKLSSVPSLEELTKGGLPVSNLSNIGWDDRFTGFLTPAFFLLLRGSTATVTHLSILFNDNISHAENYIHLFEFHFPALKSLMLGPGHLSLLSDEETPDLTEEQHRIQVDFTRFLIRHPSITVLSLDCSTKWMDWEFRPRTPSGVSSASYLRFDPRSLRTNIVPNLVALTCSPVHIVTLAQGHATLLHRISSLSITANNDDDQEGMLEMFSALSAYSSQTVDFPIQELALPSSCLVPEGAFMDNILGEWMDSSTSIFPSLEKLTVSTISLDVENFPQFENLRELVCGWRPEHFRKRYVEVISNICPSLEVVYFEDPNVTYRITRGAVLQVTAEAANPQDIEEPENSDDSESEGYGRYDI